jgi:hypothetical protein
MVLYWLCICDQISDEHLQGFTRGPRTKPNDQPMDTLGYGRFDPFWSNVTARFIDSSETLLAIFQSPENTMRPSPNDPTQGNRDS